MVVDLGGCLPCLLGFMLRGCSMRIEATITIEAKTREDIDNIIDTIESQHNIDSEKVEIIE